MKQKLYLLKGEPTSVIPKNKIKEFKLHLEKICYLLNRRYEKHIHTQLYVNENCQIICLLNNISRSYDLVDTILKGSNPHTFHFVLIHDYINTSTLPNLNTITGPAMNKASQTLNRMSKEDNNFEMSVEREETDLAISGLITSILLLKNGLTPKKRRIISEYVKTGKQSIAAEKLGMTQQGISKALKKSNWREIRDGEEKLRRSLEIYSARLGRKQASLDDFY
jgi:hypothetical protein